VHESGLSQTDLDGGLAPVAIALGSNLPGPVGEPRDAITWASRRIASTPGVSNVRLSAIIRTEPVGPSGQPTYSNAALTCLVDPALLGPRALLNALLDIERKAGRNRDDEPRWGPRTLDLDLLLYGDRVLYEPGLTVPHPRMLDRRFVLEPLAEIAGYWTIPAPAPTQVPNPGKALDTGSGEALRTVRASLDDLARRDPSP